MPQLNRRQIETIIAALVAVGAGIVGIANREAARSLGPKFVALERIARLQEPRLPDPAAQRRLAALRRRRRAAPSG